MQRKLSIVMILIMVVSLSGCAWWSDFWKRSDMAKNTPENLYKTGHDYFQNGRYKKAAESFQRLKELHPLHPLAIHGEMGIADAHYSDKEYGEAELAYNDFMNLHPTNENIPYVLYQIGMCHFNQMQTIDRDQSEALRAKREFDRLIARFPSSKFAFLAEKQLRECRKKLAEHEFYVGEFYFKQKKYKAAMRRFETIARDYANLGLDYKVQYYLVETMKLFSEEQARQKKEEEKAREKEEKAKAKAKAKEVEKEKEKEKEKAKEKEKENTAKK